MLVMVDERQLVTVGYRNGFESEGIALAGFTPIEFIAWIENAPDHELAAVEGFLIGESERRNACARALSHRSQAPVTVRRRLRRCGPQACPRP